jgi:hypothetical protein
MGVGVLVFAGALSGGHAVISNHSFVSQKASNSISKLTEFYSPSPGSQTTFTVTCQAGVACTQIYGGPETAAIKGTVKGSKINSAFSRTDGFQIARWNAAKAFFTFPGYATVQGRIEVSPTCPGAVKPGQNCTNNSVAGTVTFTSKVHANVRTMALAERGFSVLLRTGTWTLTGTSPVAMRCTPSTLTVLMSSEVVISCDTGIR